MLALTTCTPTPDRELRYEAAFDAACTNPAYPTVRTGLRLGMPEDQVRQHLDSLRARAELVWHLSTDSLPVEAEFVGVKQAQLQLRLGGSGLFTSCPADTSSSVSLNAATYYVPALALLPLVEVRHQIVM